MYVPVMMWKPVAALALCLSIVAASGASMAQEICPTVTAPVPATKPAPPVAPPTEFFVQTREAPADAHRLLFVGDSLIGGRSATELKRLPFAVADLLPENRDVIALSMSGRGSHFIAEKFAAVTVSKDSILVIWMGRNNYAAPDQVVADMKSVIEHAATNRVLILSVPVSTSGGSGTKEKTEVDALNARLAAEFPDTYVLVADDVTCSERADTVHFKAEGQAKVAARISAEILKRGW